MFRLGMRPVSRHGSRGEIMEGARTAMERKRLYCGRRVRLEASVNFASIFRPKPEKYTVHFLSSSSSNSALSPHPMLLLGLSSRVAVSDTMANDSIFSFTPRILEKMHLSQNTLPKVDCETDQWTPLSLPYRFKIYGRQINVVGWGRKTKDTLPRTLEQ